MLFLVLNKMFFFFLREREREGACAHWEGAEGDGERES